MSEGHNSNHGCCKGKAHREDTSHGTVTVGSSVVVEVRTVAQDYLRVT